MPSGFIQAVAASVSPDLKPRDLDFRRHTPRSKSLLIPAALRALGGVVLTRLRVKSSQRRPISPVAGMPMHAPIENVLRGRRCLRSVIAA
jgi:hypothetical protein